MSNSAGTKIIDYYLATSSPWTYLGHARLIAIAARHGAEIRIKPIDLGRIFPSSGGLPLAKRAPQRQAYRLIELDRWRSFLGVPLNLQPKFFPVAGDESSRWIIAAQALGGTAAALAMAGGILKGVWADERNVADPATLAVIAGEAALDAQALQRQAPQSQALYDRYTEEAAAANVFGAPWYVYRGVPCWGQDRLEFLDRALAAD